MLRTKILEKLFLNRPHPAIIRMVNIPAQNQGKVLLKLIETRKDELRKKASITVDRYKVRVRLSDKLFSFIYDVTIFWITYDKKNKKGTFLQGRWC